MKTKSTETINSLIEKTPDVAKMLNNFEALGATIKEVNKKGQIVFIYNPKLEFCDFMKRQRAAIHLKQITGLDVLFEMN